MYLRAFRRISHFRFKKSLLEKLTQAYSIINCPLHPLHKEFVMLPSGRRYRAMCVEGVTRRFKNSFIPTAISMLNSL